MVSAKVYQKWLTLLKKHHTNHHRYHKNVNWTKDIGVNIIGWHGGQFSIGEVARKLYLAAKDVKISANAIQLPPPGGKIFRHPSFLGYDLSRSPREVVNVFVVNADSVDFSNQFVPRVIRQNKYNIGYWLWELEIFPRRWMGALKEFDEIWCPSPFIKSSIETSPEYNGTPIRVLNLPLLRSELHGQAAISRTHPFEMDNIDHGDKPFTFLVVFDFKSHMERKNPLAAIRAFLDAFPASSDPTGKYQLVVKTHGGSADETMKMRFVAQNDPRVVFINRLITEAENIALHRYQDCYVSLHRSEGYGFNILESMGAGIPVIATNYSGNVDFFEALPSYLEKCHFPVPYKLVELTEDFGPYEAGNRWADANHAYVVSAMKEVTKNNCKQLHGRDMAELVYSRFSEATVGKMMQSLLRDAAPRIFKKSENFAKGADN